MYCSVTWAPNARTMPSPSDCATEPARYECASSVRIASCAWVGSSDERESTELEKSDGMVSTA